MEKITDVLKELEKVTCRELAVYFDLTAPEMLARRKAAYAGLRAAGGLSDVISDPVAWQRENGELKQQVARLTRAIEELPPKCRQVFLLIKFHHLTHAEVATKLGIAQSTVVKHMIKAVDYCRSRLDEP